MPKKVDWNHSFVRPGVRPSGPGWEACDIDPVVLDIPDFKAETAHIQIFSREFGLTFLAQFVAKMPPLHYQRAVRGMLRAAIPELATKWDSQFYEEHKRSKVLAALRKEMKRSEGLFADLGMTVEVMEIPAAAQPRRALLELEHAGFTHYRFVFSDATASTTFTCVRCGDKMMHKLMDEGIIVTDDAHDRLLVEMIAEGMQIDCRDPQPDNLDPKRNADRLARELREIRRMDEVTSFQAQRGGKGTDPFMDSYSKLMPDDRLERLGLSPEDVRRMRELLKSIQAGKDSYPNGWPPHIIVDPFDGTRDFIRGPRRGRRPQPNGRNNLRDNPDD